MQDASWYEDSGWNSVELAPAHSAAVTGGVAAIARNPSSMEVSWVGPDGAICHPSWHAP
jgi:hypothetical protein